MKAKAEDAASSAKAGVEKAKVTAGEKVEKAKTRDPMKKRDAEERKEDRKLEIRVRREDGKGRPRPREERHPHRRQWTRHGLNAGLPARPGPASGDLISITNSAICVMVERRVSERCLSTMRC